MYFKAHPAQASNGFASLLTEAAKPVIHNPSAERAEWDKRLAHYLSLHALTMAAYDYGPLATSTNELLILRHKLEAEYGPNFRKHPDAQAQWKSVSAENSRLEEEATERYSVPLWHAQRELVTCPAPDLAAALFKAELVNVMEVWSDQSLEGEAFDYVAADLERLAGEAA